MQKEENQQCNYYTDADFCRNIKIDTAHLDRSTVKSRTGFVIKFVRCKQKQ